MSEIDRLASKIESDQSIGTWETYLPTPFIKKSLGTFRVIAELRRLGDDAVVCLRHVMARGDRAYDQFLANIDGLGRSPSDEDLLSWIASRTTSTPIQLPAPSTAELAYLYDVARSESDDIVYETVDWVTRMQRLDARALPFVHQLLLDCVLTERHGDEVVARTGDTGIIYRRFPDLRRTLLIAPLFGQRQLAELPELLKRSSALLETQSQDDLMLRRASRRAYPSYVVLDAEIWLSIQSDETANLALSPEEVEILTSVVRPHPDAPCYPLFINGRPGSGKSTILKYLFAEHLARHLLRPPHERTQYPPLYLTYSESLLHDAIEAVRHLLERNAELMLQHGQIIHGQFPPEGSFSLFHKYLLKSLPEARRLAFAASQRVGYPEFRRIWDKHARANPQMRDLSPELVWHVLRSYIKGMRDEQGDYLGPERYAELPAKRRTVTKHTFDKIYHDVFEGWYGRLCAEKGLWDDQDLTHAVLTSTGDELARHPVVFCDEAQDFTRIELELIARLSVFTRRTMSPPDLKRIPIAFAGDPFQTLNPTGFQWASVQAGFHEQIVQELDRFGSARLQFNFKELAFNYRSTRPIVGFANLIQTVRGVLFGIATVRPQRSWQDERSVIPSFFVRDDPSVGDELRAHDELVIILPCQEGLEEDYIAADPLLRGLQHSGPPRNFLSAMGAKGLEFSRVVVYGFGAECLSHYPQLLSVLSAELQELEDGEAALPLEYFINRLYVAATRAKRALFIVDSHEAIERFWRAKALRDPHLLLRRLPRAGENGWVVDDLTLPQPGFPGSWSQERDDPLQLARQFLEQGQANRDPYMLSLAAANFRRAGESTQAILCSAMQKEFGSDFKGAGEAYLEIDRRQEALRCFWRGEEYVSIAAHYGGQDLLEVRAATFMAQAKPNVQEALSFLDFLHDELRGTRRQQILSDDRWVRIAAHVVDIVTQWPDIISDKPKVMAQLSRIHADGLKYQLTVQLARLAYAAAEYALAIVIWDQTAKRPADFEEYQRAKAMAEPYPSSLEWLERIGDLKGIVSAYDAHRSVALNDRQLSTVARALAATGRGFEAADMVEQQGADAQLLQAIMRQCLDSGDMEGATGAAAGQLRALARVHKWADSILAYERLPLPAGNRLELARIMVLEAAISDATAHSGQFAQFIDRYVVEEDNWTSDRIRACGAAHERLHTIVASLQFYEAIWKERRIPASHVIVEEAKKRWSRCKHRHAIRLTSQNRKPEAEHHRAEGDAMLLTIGVSLHQVPEFPRIERPARTAIAASSPIVSPQQQAAIIALSRAGADWTPERIAEALKLRTEQVALLLENLQPRSEEQTWS